MRIGTLESIQMTQKEIDKASYGCVSCAEASNPERIYRFPRGKLKRGGRNMHFSASDSSSKMMMDFISSANDFCNVFRMCDHLGKINEIDLES